MIMNCEHLGEGWCLKCVAAKDAELEQAQAAAAEMPGKLLAWLDKFATATDITAMGDDGGDERRHDEARGIREARNQLAHDMPKWPNPGQPILARLAAAEPVMALLPTYADTGKPFVPNRGSAWVLWKSQAVPANHVWWNRGTAKWSYNVASSSDRTMVYGPAYSTEQAARDAAEKESGR